MASYYYLISSLPDLRTDGELTLSYDDFLEMCKSNVSNSKYRLLEELTLSSAEGPLVKEWSEFYGKLTKELNFQRSMNLGRSYSSAYDKDGEIAQVVSMAMSAKNPLEAERILLEYEFANLDTMTGLHAFDDHVLFGYAIKLKLLERQNCFNRQKGQAEWTRLFTKVQKRIASEGI